MTVITAGVTGGIPYETLTCVLAANEIRSISKTTAYLSVLSATTPASILISFNGASFFVLPPGISISDFLVDQLWIQNSSGGVNTVTIATGVAVFRDNRLVIDAASPLPVTLPANQSVNQTQVNGVAVSVNAGAADAGCQRVTLATNSAVNVAQINGVTPDMNTGASSANTLRVALANNSSCNIAQYGGTTVVNGGVAGIPAVGGNIAHSAAATANPIRMAGTAKTAVDTTLVAGDVCDMFMTDGGAHVIKPYAIPQLDWSYAAATGGILNTTTGVTVKTAAGAGVRNYITGFTLMAEALGAATEFVINDGAAGTVLWRQKIPLTGLLNGLRVTFPSPLKGTANTLVEIKTLTASVTGAVFANLQGYTAP